LFLVPGVIGNLQAIEIIKIIVGLKCILENNKLYNNNVPYKMKIWRKIYFGGLANYKNPTN